MHTHTCMLVGTSSHDSDSLDLTSVEYGTFQVSMVRARARVCVSPTVIVFLTQLLNVNTCRKSDVDFFVALSFVSSLLGYTCPSVRHRDFSKQFATSQRIKAIKITPPTLTPPPPRPSLALRRNMYRSRQGNLSELIGTPRYSPIA